MIRTVAAFCLALSTLSVNVQGQDDYPKPSPYPVAWEFDFQHSDPKRIVVDAPGQNAPQAYWYVTYTVTNNTDKERPFLPVFEMLANDGRLIRSDFAIPPQVFSAIQQREKLQFLQPAHEVAGQLRLGDDQARDGVAIWPEPMAEMGQFSIFIEGLSGETAELKVGDESFNLHKELELSYIIRGDDVRPSLDEVSAEAETWVMR